MRPQMEPGTGMMGGGEGSQAPSPSLCWKACHPDRWLGFFPPKWVVSCLEHRPRQSLLQCSVPSRAPNAHGCRSGPGDRADGRCGLPQRRAWEAEGAVPSRSSPSSPLPRLPLPSPPRATGPRIKTSLSPVRSTVVGGGRVGTRGSVREGRREDNCRREGSSRRTAAGIWAAPRASLPGLQPLAPPAPSWTSPQNISHPTPGVQGQASERHRCHAQTSEAETGAVPAPRSVRPGGDPRAPTQLCRPPSPGTSPRERRSERQSQLSVGPRLFLKVMHGSRARDREPVCTRHGNCEPCGDDLQTPSSPRSRTRENSFFQRPRIYCTF